MSDWYVDNAVVGGNGTAPNTAFASVSSIVWAAGDRAWVRRTHLETYVSSQALGPNFNLDAFSRIAHCIGWPDVGDPWYTERPSAGVSASWDSDAPSTEVYSLWGYKFPTIQTSTANQNGTAILLGASFGLYNFCLRNTAYNGTMPIGNGANVNFSTARRTFLDNFIIITSSGGFFPNFASGINAGNFSVGKYILISSGGSNGLFSSGNMPQCRHLLVHSKTVAPYMFVTGGGTTAGQMIGVLELQTSSIPVMFSQNGRTTTGVTEQQWRIGRVVGVKPYNGISSGPAVFPDIGIDDYFGQGPVCGGGLGDPFFRVASINEVGCDIGSGAQNALIYNVTSQSAANQAYQELNWQQIQMRKYFSVSSGQGIEIRVPIYVDSTGVFSPANGTMKSYMQAAGCKTSVAGSAAILVGTPANWSGSLIAGGSAYLWASVFTPTETNSYIPVDFSLGLFTQATSGLGLTGAAYFGEPYKV
jgi:hypothetical protein